MTKGNAWNANKLSVSVRSVTKGDPSWRVLVRFFHSLARRSNKWETALSPHPRPFRPFRGLCFWPYLASAGGQELDGSEGFQVWANDELKKRRDFEQIRRESSRRKEWACFIFRKSERKSDLVILLTFLLLLLFGEKNLPKNEIFYRSFEMDRVRKSEYFKQTKTRHTRITNDSFSFSRAFLPENEECSRSLLRRSLAESPQLRPFGQWARPLATPPQGPQVILRPSEWDVSH